MQALTFLELASIEKRPRRAGTATPSTHAEWEATLEFIRLTPVH
jgi:hypothetical protein